MILQQLEINCTKPKSPLTCFRLRRTTENISLRPKYYEFQIYYNALKLRTLSRNQYQKLLTYIDEKSNPLHRDNRRYQEFHAADLLPDMEFVFDLFSQLFFQVSPQQTYTFKWYWNVYGYYFIQDQLTHFMDKTIIITGHIPCHHELHYKSPLDRELPTSNVAK